MKIFIAVPTFENISPDTFKSIYGLDRGGHWVVFDYVRGYDCAHARNLIGKQAIVEESDYVLMVDSDIVVPGDALVRMLELGEDVVIGCCAHRSGGKYTGKTSICKDDGEFDYTHQYTAAELLELQEKGVYKLRIHGGGMGCTLIRTELFRKLPYPWFKWTDYGNGNVLSEDLYFCEQCRIAGIPVYSDTRVMPGHIFRYVQEVE